MILKNRYGIDLQNCLTAEAVPIAREKDAGVNSLWIHACIFYINKSSLDSEQRLIKTKSRKSENRKS